MIKQSKFNERVKKQPLSLKSNSIWNLIGSIVYALTQWLVLIVIAKLGTPEMVGIFTLALAITAPLVLFFRFNLRSIVASDSHNDFSFNTYHTLRAISTIFFTIIAISIAIFYAPDWEIMFVIIALSLAKTVESISDILHGQMQKFERLDIAAKSRIMKGLLSLIIFSIVMYFTKNLTFATFSYLFSWIFILIIYDYPKANTFGKISIQFKKKDLKYLFLLSIPLGFAQLIASLNANMPRYLLEYFHDPKTLGFFGAIMYIVTAGNNFVMAISAAVIPRLAKSYHSNKLKDFIKIISGYMGLVIAFSVISLIIAKLFGKEILILIYTPEYGAFSNEFFYFLLLGLIIYVNKVLETALTATRVFKVQPYINILTLIIIILFSVILIPEKGIIGALYSLMLGESIQFLIRSIILITILKRRSKL